MSVVSKLQGEEVVSGLFPKAILFDLDGTLVDTAQITVEAFNFVREARGLKAIVADDIKPYISLGGQELTRFALGSSPVDVDADLALFRKIVGRLSANGSMIYPGVVRLLADLRENGVKLAVVTNKPQSLAVPLLDALGLSAYFSCVLGGDAVPHKKPHPSHINAALSSLSLCSRDVVLVGDSEVDMEAAANSGVIFFHFAGGYCGHDLLHDSSLHRFSHFDDLLQLLNSSSVRAARLDRQSL